MKFICLPKYTEKSASSRYRTFQYLSYFKDYAHIEVYPFFDNYYNPGCKMPFFFKLKYLTKRYFKRLKILINKSDKFDFFFVEKEFFPFIPFEKLILRIFKIKYVLDYDDAIFHHYDDNHSKLVRLILSKKIPSIISHSKGVITGSPYLTRYAKKYSNNVIEIPTSIDLDKYPISKIKPESNKFTVGWIGSKTTSKNLRLLIEAINQISNFKENIIFNFIGFDLSMSSEFKHLPIKFIEWDGHKEADQINNFDIGIMPLEFNLFNKGKCAFKLIQYMACSKPTISSPLESNINVDKGNGNLFAKTSQDWVEAILKIKSNYDSFIQIGIKNKQTVIREFSVQSNSKKYQTFFEKISSQLK